MKKDPTQEQLSALRVYASEHGRNWKSALRDSWMTGIYDGSADAGQLQQVRNALGPSWLVRFRFQRADGLEQLRGAVEDMRFLDRATSNLKVRR